MSINSLGLAFASLILTDNEIDPYSYPNREKNPSIFMSGTDFMSGTHCHFNEKKRRQLFGYVSMSVSSFKLRALTMQDSITEFKTFNYTLFMVFC